jgi:hypothetical protein
MNKDFSASELIQHLARFTQSQWEKTQDESLYLYFKAKEEEVTFFYHPDLQRLDIVCGRLSFAIVNCEVEVLDKYSVVFRSEAGSTVRLGLDEALRLHWLVMLCPSHTP